MRLYAPLPDDVDEILGEIERINDEVAQLAHEAIYPPKFSGRKLATDVVVGAAGLVLLGGPATLLGLAFTAWGFLSPSIDIANWLADIKGKRQIEARVQALEIRRAKLWRKAKLLDPRL